MTLNMYSVENVRKTYYMHKCVDSIVCIMSRQMQKPHHYSTVCVS